MLLLDEPVVRHEPVGDRAVHAARSARIRARGITILLVEHDMPMVMGVSDRIVVLNYGHIIAEGSPAAIQANPEVIRAYLGQGASTCLSSTNSSAATARSTPSRASR